VIAARGLWLEGRFLAQPLGTQPIEMGATELKPFGGGLPIHLPAVEERKGLLDQFRSNAVSQLNFFTAQDSMNTLGALPPNPRSFSL